MQDGFFASISCVRPPRLEAKLRYNARRTGCATHTHPTPLWFIFLKCQTGWSRQRFQRPIFIGTSAAGRHPLTFQRTTAMFQRLALLPACADPQVITRQDCSAYAAEPLRTAGLLEAAPRYNTETLTQNLLCLIQTQESLS